MNKEKRVHVYKEGFNILFYSTLVNNNLDKEGMKKAIEADLISKKVPSGEYGVICGQETVLIHLETEFKAKPKALKAPKAKSNASTPSRGKGAKTKTTKK